MNIDGFGVAQKGSRIELVVALLCVVFFFRNTNYFLFSQHISCWLWKELMGFRDVLHAMMNQKEKPPSKLDNYFTCGAVLFFVACIFPFTSNNRSN